MNTPSNNRLYQLLPAIYRERDRFLAGNYRKSLDQAELKQLLAIIERELDILETDIGDLYENWFIETCDDWVVPYIGDLLGVSGIGTRNNHPQQLTQVGGYGRQETRAYVANTLAYRRRKGTATVLEQLARDVTGWRARAVEFFEHLAISQNLNHLRLKNTTVDLKASGQIQLVGSPFEEQAAYSVEISQISSDRGKYNIYNIGLFLWRLHTYRLVRVRAYQVQNSDSNPQGRCYTFSPLGNFIPLFNLPQLETDIAHLAEEINVPGKLRTDPNYPGYYSPNPVFQIFINGQPHPIPPEEVLITKLNQDNTPLEKWEIPKNEPQPTITDSPKQIKRVAVDPEYGKIAFLDQNVPSQVTVNYAYGFSADIGGGPYSRGDTMAQIPSETLPQPLAPFFPSLYWEVEKERSGSVNPLLDAVQTWNGTVKAWQSLLDLTFIPLAHLEIPKKRVSHEKDSSETCPKFQFGIVQGLTLDSPDTTIGSKEIVITPGLAINKQGIAISVEQNIVIKLDQIKSSLPAKQPLLVILSYWIVNNFEPSYQINVIPYKEEKKYPEDTYIRLTSFSLDRDGKIESISNLDSFPFTPGIVEGFSVITPPDVLEAIVTPGTAVDDLGRVIILDRNIPLDLRKYQKQKIWITITYSNIPGGGNWQLYILLDADAKDEKRYPVNRYIRLAHLFVPEIKINKLEAGKTISPQFVAGVVKGLKVIGEIGDRSVTITAGKAINGEVKEIILEQDYHFRNLGSYRNKTVTLTIAYRQETFGSNWELKILQADDLANYPQDNYLRLAKLQIGNTGKLTAEPEDLLSTFQPGILINNLEVTNPKSAIVKVTKGKAVDSSGQIISLDSDCEIDLSKYPGRELILFISYQQKQGWKPLDNTDVNTSETGQSWQHLGTVPIEHKANQETSKAEDNKIYQKVLDLIIPNQKNSKTGVILIKDNQSYQGDIDLIIPNSKNLQLKLQLLAANSYRPHIKGNLSIQGQINPNDRHSPEFEPGECLLDGLLIEGQLTVHSGDLKNLSINHCTLVPNLAYGLTVESSISYQNIDNNSNDTPNPNQTDDDDENGSFIFLVISLFYLIFQIIKLGFSKDIPPRQRLQNLTQYVMIEWEKLWCAFQEQLYQCQQSDKANDTNCNREWLCESLCCTIGGNGFSGDNGDLGVRITYSILGFVNLADSVPDLVIYDSIIGKKAMNSSVDSQDYPLAITALGAKADIQRSTILGITNLRRLEANASLFNDVVSVIDRQKGCLRFCYVPLGSQTPLRYRCQPDLALQELPSLPAAITSFAIDPNTHQVFLGTAGQGILELPDNSKKWQPTKLTDQFITALTYYRRIDSQIVFFAGARGNKIYRHPSNQENWDEINNKTSINADITALITYTNTKPLRGTISSQGITVTGLKTAFTTELTPGNSIKIVRQNQEETRTIIKIDSPTSLTIDRAFSPDLPAETPYTISILLAGTANGYIWQFNESGDTWIAMPIDNKPIAGQITSVAIDSQGRIFAGTDTGVFRWSVKKQGWNALNQGLTNLQITALAIDSNDRVFAATAAGLIFRSLDHGKHWQSVSKGLTQTRITSLAIQTITGRVQVNDRQLIVIDEQIVQKLKEGSTITIGNQTRVIQSIDIPTRTIILDAQFCPALSGEIEFTSHYLFAGTAASGIFRSYNNGDRWESLTLSSYHRQITVLVVDRERNQIWTGTATGNVFRSSNQGEQWEAINQGLKDVDNVDKITPILLRVEPRYTTTDYNQPAYAQLSQNCASEILQGAEDGSEMGAFNLLKQPQREGNLKVLLDEYVRFGLKAGIFYIT